MVVKVVFNLPEKVHAMRYVRNHHYIELEDKQGHMARLNANGLIKGVCTQCNQVFYVESHMGSLRCPHCGGTAELVWGRVQLAFIPETEQSFGAECAIPEDAVKTGEIEVVPIGENKKEML